MVSTELAAAVDLYHARKRPEARFWAKVRKGEGCWEWIGYVHKTGYGYFTAHRKTWRAPRFAWHLTNGPIPADKHILHSCDNRLCVRPDHLRLGTPKENTADMYERNRHAFSGKGKRDLAEAREEIGRLHQKIEILKKDLEVERARVRWLRAMPKVRRAQAV